MGPGRAGHRLRDGRTHGAGQQLLLACACGPCALREQYRSLGQAKGKGKHSNSCNAVLLRLGQVRARVGAAQGRRQPAELAGTAGGGILSGKWWC